MAVKKFTFATSVAKVFFFPSCKLWAHNNREICGGKFCKFNWKLFDKFEGIPV